MKHTSIDIVNTISFIVVAFFIALAIDKSVNPKDQSLAYFLLIVVSGVFLLRKLPVVDVIWSVLKMIIVGIFAAIFVDYAKKEVKEWWNK
jgi:predicted branched-subunit amino acid permease